MGNLERTPPAFLQSLDSPPQQSAHPDWPLNFSRNRPCAVCRVPFSTICPCHTGNSVSSSRIQCTTQQDWAVSELADAGGKSVPREVLQWPHTTGGGGNPWTPPPRPK